MNTTTDPVARTRQIFDKALSESVDLLFTMPDIVAAVAAVFDGKAGILIVNGVVTFVPVIDPDDETPPVELEAPADDAHGMYL